MDWLVLSFFVAAAEVSVPQLPDDAMHRAPIPNNFIWIENDYLEALCIWNLSGVKRKNAQQRTKLGWQGAVHDQLLRVHTIWRRDWLGIIAVGDTVAAVAIGCCMLRQHQTTTPVLQCRRTKSRISRGMGLVNGQTKVRMWRIDAWTFSSCFNVIGSLCGGPGGPLLVDLRYP